MIPGSSDIFVDVSPVERAYSAEMPDWQFGGVAAGLVGGAFVYELFQQSLYRDASPACFLSEARFGCWRDFETHGALYNTPFIVRTKSLGLVARCGGPLHQMGLDYFNLPKRSGQPKAASTKP
jgi:hypothetical protein